MCNQVVLVLVHVHSWRVKKVTGTFGFWGAAPWIVSSITYANIEGGWLFVCTVECRLWCTSVWVKGINHVRV